MFPTAGLNNVSQVIAENADQIQEPKEQTVLGTILSTIGNLAGGTGGVAPVVIEPVQEEKPTGLYIALGVLAIAIIGGVYYATQK